MYNIPTSKSHNTSPSPNGITAQAINASKNVKTGAAKKTTVFALLGKTGSLITVSYTHLTLPTILLV